MMKKLQTNQIFEMEKIFLDLRRLALGRISSTWQFVMIQLLQLTWFAEKCDF